jgi:hypothetical protein
MAMETVVLWIKDIKNKQTKPISFCTVVFIENGGKFGIGLIS